MSIAEKEWIRECWSKAIRDLNLALQNNTVTKEILDNMNKWNFRFMQANDDTERLIRESGIIV